MDGTSRHRLTGYASATTLRALAARDGPCAALLGSGGRGEVWGAILTVSREAGGARLDISAPELRLARILQDHIAGIADEAREAVAWDTVAEGELAPNLVLARVISVRAISPAFLRVRVAGDALGRFASGGLHFRLLLPPAGRTPRWPRTATSGRSVWPDGEDALHRPVYTTVAQAGDWLDFDVFRHAGSPTCDWAAQAAQGEEVGLMGPGGGWCPEGTPLRVFGDETALPAVRRMLSLASGEVRAWVCAAAEDMGELAGDRRVRRVASLLDSLRGVAPPPAGFTWFAASEAEARAARRHLSGLGVPKAAFTAAAYWR